MQHYLTLSPMVAYKVALGYATDNGLMYYRTALPNSSARLIAKPCAPPLALMLEVSPAKLVCPLFDLLGVRNQLMFPDWMHVMDEGFGALVSRQILHYLLPLYPGNSAAKRVGKMWEHIQCLYQADKTEACRRLTKLTLKDIVKRKKPAELDVKAAHCCQSSLKQNSAMWGQGQSNSKECMCWPNSWPMQGSSASVWLWSLQLKSKGPENFKDWQRKPKCHLFGHLCDSACQGWNPITGMRLLLFGWQKWDSREVVQIANPWQKQSSSGGCPSSTGLLSNMKYITPKLNSFFCLTQAIPSLTKAISSLDFLVQLSSVSKSHP